MFSMGRLRPAACPSASPSRAPGVVSWKQCLSDNQAWDTLTWFAALIAMAAYLNKYGFISWFSDKVRCMACCLCRMQYLQICLEFAGPGIGLGFAAWHVRGIVAVLVMFAVQLSILRACPPASLQAKPVLHMPPPAQVVGMVGGLGLSWQATFGIILTLYFYSHYFFASGAQRQAGSVAIGCHLFDNLRAALILCVPGWAMRGALVINDS